MAEDGILGDLRRGRASTFGPEADALLRAIDARACVADRQGTEAMLRLWPRHADGTPLRPEQLREGLAALLSDISAARRADHLASLKEAGIAALLGGAVGFAGYVVAALAMPSGEGPTLKPLMPWATGLPASAAAILAYLQARRPTRRRRTLKAGFTGLVTGGMLGAAGGLLALAGLVDEGHAMGVVLETSPILLFGLVLLASALGGAAGCWWCVAAAMRRWDGGRVG